MRLFENDFTKKYYLFLLLSAILLVAATLRSPMTSVGPLIPLYRGDLEASNGMGGLVNTLPLITFGLFSPFIPKISRKHGMEMTLLIAMVVLSICTFIRASGGIELLLFGTLLMGMAIAVGNILMPGLIKSSFPYRIGLMTGLYSVSMNLFGALASGISVPIASISGLDWRNAMQIWSFLSLLAVVVLLLRLPISYSGRKKGFAEVKSQPSKAIFKSKIAWAVTFFMDLQSLIPNSLFTWLPEISLIKGFNESEAGWLIAICQASLIPATFIAPILADRMQNQRLLGISSGLLFFFGLAGIAFSSSYIIIGFLALTGVGAGAAFSLSMMFFVLRTNTTMESAQLSGMAQSIGYIIAATGPLFLGIIADITGGWAVPFIILMAAALCIAFLGDIAGKDRKVSSESTKDAVEE